MFDKIRSVFQKNIKSVLRLKAVADKRGFKKLWGLLYAYVKYRQSVSC